MSITQVRNLLPETFIQQSQQLLGDQMPAFLASYDAPRAYGLRFNPIKLPLLQWAGDQRFQALSSLFSLEPIEWCKTGFYYNEATRPGKHPYHAAGLYYIQEPSAMSAADALEAHPGETILDLAAAPGGKTTQIAGAMNNQGLLIANEIHPARAKILSENVERCGFRNTVVTCATPDQLSERFPIFFDRIMLDAPCSGEGMFRKDPDAIAEWSPAHVELCATRQADILVHAARMLKPGGRLVYSTCTFNRAENEDAIAAFLEAFPAFKLERTERLWPHQCRGEGHFVAVLTKSKDADASADAALSSSPRPRSKPKRNDRRAITRPGNGHANLTAEMALFESFAQEALPRLALGPGEPLRFGDALYWLPHDAEKRFGAFSLHGLKVVRPGLHLGDIRTKRIEPAHALAISVSEGEAARAVSYPADSPELAAFLRGEALQAPDGINGWTLIAVDSLPVGWAKASESQLKNHLPKGLRRLS
ncbi:RsmB/NOP family class I SAM-dependent RNA methyltransferase [Paenibacillus sp. MMS18-CY102]|uniref:RsmB/NOP family class I SAM-dependent RNA methyltransferase n=1 Tax=Paenibacillus sp. MMS18-CY102 TaxID=2682849 RepID=UPI001365CC5F|nr:RsmB/NOP family class I SAM-dependent RNA methyltransferase [Paenibacillus sp. MMS18-CY102]MWC28935.1 RNA methyltransferase [Paenibacillus sp. MMS18-CY102]